MKIAIKGHLKRGKEVIQILESLGGINRMNHMGCYDKHFYYISIDTNTIVWTSVRPIHLSIFTLDEFEKEFPFKIGDKVITPDHKSYKIIALENYNNKIYYKLDNGFHYVPQVLKPYKEMKEKRNITLALDKAKEWYKKGGELKEIALQAFTEKELNPLPRSWEEFCKQGNPIASWRYSIPTKYEALYQLEQLRNCWWGDWKPDYNCSTKYVIKWDKNDLIVATSGRIRAFLSFPIREMAEEFLKCFRDLIKQTGDLI